MVTVESRARIKLQNILYLTDFSESSEAALPFAIAIARRYAAHVHALHILVPEPYVYSTPTSFPLLKETAEENAKAELQRVGSLLAGLPHETIMECGVEVWPTIERSIKDLGIDLIVLGTHGRTGAQKLLLGSIAEEIFRCSPLPVLTISPNVRIGLHSGGRFHSILFATDFSPEAQAAAPYAVSLVQENQARLFSVHVIPQRRHCEGKEVVELSAAEAIHQLYEIVPRNADLATQPQVIVEYGEPAARILEVAKQRGADLVVLGVRAAAGRLGAATHLERAIAHKVVAHALCPVLTIRG